MTVRSKRHPALKHAGYSSAGLLPGEDAADFAKLHRELVAEFSPQGALEEEIVKAIAHCVWRRRNLATFRVAKRAQRYMRQMSAAAMQASDDASPSGHDPADLERRFMQKWNALEGQAREELGEFYALVEMGEEATFDGLRDELEVQSRLDATIDRCIKRLLLVRGLKSMSIGPASHPAPPQAIPFKRD